MSVFTPHYTRKRDKMQRVIRGSRLFSRFSADRDQGDSRPDRDKKYKNALTEPPDFYIM